MYSVCLICIVLFPSQINLIRARLQITGINGNSLQDQNASAKRGTFLHLQLSDIVSVDSQPLPTITWFETAGDISSIRKEITNSIVGRSVSVTSESAGLMDLSSHDQGLKVKVKFDNSFTGESQESPYWNVEVGLEPVTGE